jgi:hypothetical protein
VDERLLSTEERIKASNWELRVRLAMTDDT